MNITKNKRLVIKNDKKSVKKALNNTEVLVFEEQQKFIYEEKYHSNETKKIGKTKKWMNFKNFLTSIFANLITEPAKMIFKSFSFFC